MHWFSALRQWRGFDRRTSPFRLHLLLTACLVATVSALSIDIAQSADRAAPNADSTIYHDGETGFTFSQYFAKYSLSNQGIYYRVGVPSSVPSGGGFDVVVQIAAGVDVGWAGLAWGGGMLANPLAAAWGYSRSAMISSRWATDHQLPSPYTGATYTILKTGTHMNATHWQVTAKCSGCTAFRSGGQMTQLTAHGSNRLAFAYSSERPTTPSSNRSDFVAHSVIGYWNHDFSAGANAAFSSLVSRNSEGVR